MDAATLSYKRSRENAQLKKDDITSDIKYEKRVERANNNITLDEQQTKKIRKSLERWKTR